MLKNVWFKYQNGDWVLKDINLKLEKGFIVLAGPNGAGKSTLLKLIAGFHKPNVGEIIINGHKIKNIRDVVGLVTYVPSNPLVFLVGPTVKSDFIRAMNSFSYKVNIESLVEYLDIKHLVNKRIFHLSEGETRITAALSAYLLGTKVLLLDEPTVGLDKKLREKLLFIISEACKRGIVIVATNDLRLASRADQIIFLNNGRIEDIGPPGKILYSHSFIKHVGSTDIIEFCREVRLENPIRCITPVELSSVLIKLLQGDS